MRVELVGGDSESAAHVVFLHGLQGGWRSTWTAAKKDAPWPCWLAEEDPGLAVWCVDYAASVTQWTGTAMPIRDRATSLLGALADAHDIGTKPLILVGHSLGGLLIKQMIRHSRTMMDQYRGFADKLSGVVFFSTPHTGSGLASLASYFKVARATPLVRELASNDPYLRELDDWYRNYASAMNIPTLSFYEKLKTMKLQVVDETSGDPHLPNSTAIPVDADHISVCKFKDRDDLVYLQTRRFILKHVEAALPPQQAAPEPQQSRPAPHVPGSPAPAAYGRVAALGDVAALALLTDQLPTGGWTRSLARWMTRHASASGTAAPNRPPMRVHGGIDVTCAALNRLVTLGDLSSPEMRAALRPALESGARFLRTRTPPSGAVGARIPQRTEPTEIRVRHTAITLATLIRVQEHLGERVPYPEVVRCARYLVGHLQYWQEDTSSVFGTTMSSLGLLDLLRRDGSSLGPNLADDLSSLLSTTVEDMALAMLARPLEGSFDDAYAGAHESALRFGTYGALSALAQSSFLFGAKQLTVLRRPYRPVGLAEQRLCAAIAEACAAFGRDAMANGGLLRVRTIAGSRPDLGLSIQCYSVLRDLAENELIDQRLGVDVVATLYRAIEQALFQTSPTELARLLTFTHGEQLSGLLDDERIAQAFVADTNAAQFVRDVSSRTLTQREITTQLLQRTRQRHRPGDPAGPTEFGSVAEIWTSFLDNGFYPLQQSEQLSGTHPWRMSAEASQRVGILERDWLDSGLPTLWIATPAGIGTEPAIGAAGPAHVTRLELRQWLDGSLPVAQSGFAHVYLPTDVSAESPAFLSTALKAAGTAMNAAAEGIVCLRLGDHRRVTAENERVCFIEDVTELERTFNECGLELAGTDVILHDIHGTEMIARFRKQRN